MNFTNFGHWRSTVAIIKYCPLDPARADPTAGAKSQYRRSAGPGGNTHRIADIRRTRNANRPLLFEIGSEPLEPKISVAFHLKWVQQTRNAFELPLIIFQLRNIRATLSLCPRTLRTRNTFRLHYIIFRLRHIRTKH